MARLFYGFRYWARIFWHAAKKFSEYNYFSKASTLAYVTSLSLVPFLSILVYVTTYFINVENFLTLSKQYLYDNFLPGPTIRIQDYLVTFLTQASHLPLLSILFSLATGIILIMTVEDALNPQPHLRRRKKKSFTYFFCLIILILIPFFIGFSVFFLEYFISIIAWNPLQKLTILIFSILTNGCIFTLLYFAIPNIPMRLRDAFISGLITSILFELTKKAFVLYITDVTNYARIYGALAILPIFLFWLYLVWAIFLFGAMLLFERQKLRASLHNKSAAD